MKKKLSPRSDPVTASLVNTGIRLADEAGVQVGAWYLARKKVPLWVTYRVLILKVRRKY